MILVLTPGVFDKGGIARYGRFQIAALRAELGDDAVRVVSLAGRQIGDLEQPFSVTWAGAVPISVASRAHFAAAAGREALRRRPRIILCAHVNLGPLAWSLARATGARLVTNIYGREIWSGLRPHRRFALRRADRVISDCHNSATRAVELRLTRRPADVVWDCVDTARYTPGEPDWPSLDPYGVRPGGPFRLLFLGRINRAQRYKGTERLLHLARTLPADRFRVVYAGKGDDVEALRQQAAQLGLGDRVHFTGPIAEPHMPHIYRAADAFYLVSEVGHGQGEGLPLTPIEAMACGVPVVVGNQDGSREILVDGGGVCTDPEDLAAQASYLQRVAADAALHRAERAAARARALEAFGFEAFARKTAAIIERTAA